MTALACVLAGCGIIPAVVQKTTQVALLPVTTTANSLSRDARLMSRAFEYSATRVGRGLEVGAASLNNSARSLAYSTERVAVAAQQSTSPPIQIHTGGTGYYDASNQQSNEMIGPDVTYAEPPQPVPVPPPPQVDILPPSVLAQLTEDQAGLQRAAQSEAFNAPVGEEIYWEIDGRTGSAVAESENSIGGFVCRTFLQTLVLEDENLTEGEATMCRNHSGVWTASF